MPVIKNEFHQGHHRQALGGRLVDAGGNKHDKFEHAERPDVIKIVPRHKKADRPAWRVQSPGSRVRRFQEVVLTHYVGVLDGSGGTWGVRGPGLLPAAMAAGKPPRQQSPTPSPRFRIGLSTVTPKARRSRDALAQPNHRQRRTGCGGGGNSRHAAAFCSTAGGRLVPTCH